MWIILSVLVFFPLRLDSVLIMIKRMYSHSSLKRSVCVSHQFNHVFNWKRIKPKRLILTLTSPVRPVNWFFDASQIWYEARSYRNTDQMIFIMTTVIVVISTLFLVGNFLCFFQLSFEMRQDHTQKLSGRGNGQTLCILHISLKSVHFAQ